MKADGQREKRCVGCGRELCHSYMNFICKLMVTVLPKKVEYASNTLVSFP